MDLSGRQIAEAISGHDFEKAFPSLADDVTWDLVGSDVLVGKDAVVAACRETARHLVGGGVEVDVERFRVVDGGDAVIVDTLTSYRSPDGDHRVASCDLYAFRDGLLVAMTSYTVEVAG